MIQIKHLSSANSDFENRSITRDHMNSTINYNNHNSSGELETIKSSILCTVKTLSKLIKSSSRNTTDTDISISIKDKVSNLGTFGGAISYKNIYYTIDCRWNVSGSSLKDIEKTNFITYPVKHVNELTNVNIHNKIIIFEELK